MAGCVLPVGRFQYGAVTASVVPDAAALLYQSAKVNVACELVPSA